MQPQSPYQPQPPQSPPQPGAQPVQPQYPAPQAPVPPQPYSQPQQVPVQPAQPYEFILNPPPPPKKPLLPGSLLARLGLGFAGLLVFMILLNVFKGFFTTEPPFNAYITTAQNQQQLIHLTTNALGQTDLPLELRNFSATAQASLTSSQAATLRYLSSNGKQVKVNELTIGVSTALDQRLQTANAATTFNQTYQDIMKAQLSSYMTHLQQAYDASTGANGRTLLKDEYQQAQLLMQQLTDASVEASN